MIQKNSDAEVTDHTTHAAETVIRLSPSQTKEEITTTITSALDRVCKLKGVGPATGTLILSVFSPDAVPFFQDELFAWLIPEHSAKLKYDKKEYSVLLDRALDIVLKKGIEARQLEKAAYVLMHVDLLTEEQKQKLLECSERSESHTAEQLEARSPGQEKGNQSEISTGNSKPQVKSVRRSRKAAVEDDESNLRQPKRRKA